jgi:hypothetical protein
LAEERVPLVMKAVVPLVMKVCLDCNDAVTLVRKNVVVVVVSL